MLFRFLTTVARPDIAVVSGADKVKVSTVGTPILTDDNGSAIKPNAVLSTKEASNYAPATRGVKVTISTSKLAPPLNRCRCAWTLDSRFAAYSLRWPAFSCAAAQGGQGQGHGPPDGQVNYSRSGKSPSLLSFNRQSPARQSCSNSLDTRSCPPDASAESVELDEPVRGSSCLQELNVDNVVRVESKEAQSQEEMARRAPVIRVGMWVRATFSVGT